MKLNILVAEDNKEISDFYETMLGKKGHSITVTRDGQECLLTYMEQFKINPSFYDVIIVDFMMPKVNGAELVNEIIKINPNQRIIFATAYSKDLLKEITPPKFRVEILQKPMSFSSLINIVERDMHQLPELV